MKTELREKESAMEELTEGEGLTRRRFWWLGVVGGTTGGSYGGAAPSERKRERV